MKYGVLIWLKCNNSVNGIKAIDISHGFAKPFHEIFKEGRKPQYIWVNKGKEFYNNHLKDLLDENKIALYSIENEEKSSVCYRWNRTIQTKL